MSKLSFIELSDKKVVMEKFDGLLPNFDELEVAISFKDELRKVSNLSRLETMRDLLHLTLDKIVYKLKKRVSFVGIYNLYEQVEEDYQMMDTEIEQQASKIEFLYQFIDRKRRKAKRASKKRAEANGPFDKASMQKINQE